MKLLLYALLWCLACQASGDLRVIAGGTVTGEHFTRVDTTPVLVCGPAVIQDCVFDSPSPTSVYESDYSLERLFSDAHLAKPTIGSSHIDTSKACIVIVGGGVTIRRCSFKGEVGIVCIPAPDGRLAVGNQIEDCQFSDYRFGLMALGQQNFVAKNLTGTGAVLSGGPAGHLIYFNEGQKPDGKEIRSQGVTVTGITESRRRGASTLDNCALKFKSVDGLNLSDANTDDDYGALDLLGCSGTVKGVHHKGAVAQTVFAAFRVTTFAKSDPPDGPIILSDSDFQCNGTAAPALRNETPLARFSTVTVAGGAEPVYWPNCTSVGLSYISR